MSVESSGSLMKNYTMDDYIPMADWGKDHWSTLAYAETVMVDMGGFQVGFDGRMRQGRRNFRIMGECPKPKRPTSVSMGVVMELGQGSMLRHHSTESPRIVAGHDDWHCVQDMAAEGLFTVGPDDVEPNMVLKLSEKGKDACNKLRGHKMSGGQFKDFSGIVCLTGVK